MRAPLDDLRPIRGLDDLLEPFLQSLKERSRWRVGAEAEKFGIIADSDGKRVSPLPFEGALSVTTIFEALVERHGWYEEREREDRPVISLRRGSSSITLEPGAQLELSGAPQETVHQICGEFSGHMAELEGVASECKVHWVGLGFHPFARPEELPWVPKLRYPIMRDYLPTRGGHGLDMMRRTATVQANFDYESEVDAMRKLRLALRVQPIVTAMFANSPFVEGKLTGERSHRARVWLDVDPDRTGLLPFAWGSEELGFRDYVEWALDVPMFLIKRDGAILPNTKQTFRTFLNEGRGPHRATLTDWETHLNTLFPEVRLKRTLEVRGTDGQASVLTCALPALFKGVLYDEKAMAAAEALLEPLRYDEVEAARPDIARRALRARLHGRDVAEWANALLEISSDGLGRLNNLNRSGKDERIHLTRLKELASRSDCPADELLRTVQEGPAFEQTVLTEARVL